mmetsp:Transcript_89766/g.256560  ORF Transcript_89766/g.256560 Transcript_89766/m.256560 type:complete len:119 (-) Transcript_89766:1156-1512(-)
MDQSPRAAAAVRSPCARRAAERTGGAARRKTLARSWVGRSVGPGLAGGAYQRTKQLLGGSDGPTHAHWWAALAAAIALVAYGQSQKSCANGGGGFAGSGDERGGGGGGGGGSDDGPGA